MRENEIQKLWKSYDLKLNQLLTVNESVATEITKIKAKSMISRAKPIKYLGILLGIPWIIFLDSLVIIGWNTGSIFFTISFGAISIFTKIAIAAYIYHLVLMQKIDLADSVLEMRRNMVRIKNSTINIFKIVVLQLPFWTTWYISIDIIKNTGPMYLTVNLLVTGVFTFAAFWLYRNIRLENLNKAWLKWFFSDTEWQSVSSAMDLLNQVEE